MWTFEAEINIIGINPFVSVPDEILQAIFLQADKTKGFIPIRGSVNDKPYKQTLLRYSGQWRLYINTAMLKNSPKRIGELIKISVEYDDENREIEMPQPFAKALNENREAKRVFERLSASRRLEIVSYLSRLKTEQSLQNNINRAILFLLGKEKFVGRKLL
ncbi:MAG: YdeI/OmpD-associated family protein [Saprospiraceae bacterium]|jgi:hypothetical protein|nr:YdeI/OmpD-associated family protein [Saprospiraceae bacterium]